MLHIEKSKIFVVNQQSMANRNKQQPKHNHKQNKQKYTNNGWKRLVPALVLAARSRTTEGRESLVLVLFSRRQKG